MELINKITVERYGFIYKVSLVENDKEIIIVTDVIYEKKEGSNK